MTCQRRLLFNAFGPRVPAEFKEQLFQVPQGKGERVIPGSKTRFAGNFMDLGHAGSICHFKLLDPMDEKIEVSGLVEDSNGVFCILIFLSGTAEIALEGVEGAMNIDESRFFASSYMDQRMNSLIPRIPAFENIGFSYSGGFLMNAFNGEKGPRLLERELSAGRIEKSRAKAIPSSLAVLRIAREVIGHPYHGAAEKFFLQSKMLELLVEMTMADPPDNNTWCRTRDAAHGKAWDARDILLANPQNPPSLMELEKMVGASYKTINRAFVKYFGETVYRFARDAALDLAKKELETMDVTVSEAASRCGYSHPSAFIAAYRRRFGARPGENRKNYPA